MTDPRDRGPSLDRRAFLRGAGAAAAAGLAGCVNAPAADPSARFDHPAADASATATFRGDLRNRGFRPGATVPASVEAAWTLPDVNVGEHTAPKAGAVRDPAGNYLLPGDDGAVRSVTVDGEVNWLSRTEAADRGIHGTPTVANGHAYVGAYDGALYAFDLDTGRRVWRNRLGDAIGASPTYHEGTLYTAVEYGDPTGSGFGVDAVTGREVWRDDRPTDHPHSTPAIDTDAGHFVFGANDGRCYGWSFPTMERRFAFETGGPIKGPVTIHDGGAFFGSWDSFVYRVDLADGTEDWSVETGDLVMGGIAADPDRDVVYAGGHDGILRALDAATGEAVWTYDAGGWLIGSVTTTGDTVLVGSNGGRLHAVRADDGERRWTYDPPGGDVSSDPYVDADGVVVSARATDDESGHAVRLVAAE